MNLGLVCLIVTQTGREVIVVHILAFDTATEVISAIHYILNPWEAINIITTTARLTTYIYFCMPKDVGINRTAKGIIDTSLAKIYKGITCYKALTTAAIYIFGFSQICSSTTIRVYLGTTLEVHRCTISRVVLINMINNFTMFILYINLLTYHTLLTASEHLEDIALVMVNGSATPYLGILTISATENRQSDSHNIITLTFFEVNARVTGSKYFISPHHVLIDVDNNITIHVTTLITTTINIST